MAEARSISQGEMQKHVEEADCWLAIHGKVYDVSSYLVDHPGGLDVMMEYAGKDATEEFEYYGHSNQAREHMKEFEVGSYEGGDPAPVHAAQVNTATYSVSKQKSLPIKILQALLPLIAVAIAFVLKTYFDTPAAN